jgi:hypothetical protein
MTTSCDWAAEVMEAVRFVKGGGCLSGQCQDHKWKFLALLSKRTESASFYKKEQKSLFPSKSMT